MARSARSKWTRTKNKAEVSRGHEVLSFDGGDLQIRSQRYPFCIGAGDVAKDDNIRSGTTLVPFNQELNRLMLVVKHPRAKNLQSDLGQRNEELTQQPSSAKVSILRKILRSIPSRKPSRKWTKPWRRNRPTKPPKLRRYFHGPPGKSDMETTVLKTERAAPAARGRDQSRRCSGDTHHPHRSGIANRKLMFGQGQESPCY